MEQTFQFGYGEKQITATVRAKHIEVLQAHVSSPVPPLPAEHAALQPLVDRLLSKVPSQRFASAAELLAALPGAHPESARHAAIVAAL